MSPTSKKLRGHIGLGLCVRASVRPLRFAYGQERLDKISEEPLELGSSPYLAELSPFSSFGILYSKAILSTKYLENRFS